MLFLKWGAFVCFYFKTLKEILISHDPLATFSFSVRHSVMLEQWIFNALNTVLLNATIGFLTGRSSFTVCDILCRVIWSTLDTHPQRPRAHIEFTFLSVRSWAHQQPIVLEQERNVEGEIVWTIKLLVMEGFCGTLWSHKLSWDWFHFQLTNTTRTALHHSQHKSPLCSVWGCFIFV